MTYKELIENNKDKVRSDSNLTLYFIEAYNVVFGNKPSCSGCSINNELTKLYTEINKRTDLLDTEIILNQKTMQEIKSKTFEKSILLNEDMIAYTHNKKVYRKFTNKLTDEFVIGYLTHGTPEELEERKKKFKVLPLAMREQEIKEVEKPTRKKKNK